MIRSAMLYLLINPQKWSDYLVLMALYTDQNLQNMCKFVDG